MTRHETYTAIMEQKADIMRASVGIDYTQYTTGPLAFDYERLLADTGYGLDTIRAIPHRTAVGNTPLIELTNLTELVRAVSPPGQGARLFLKDEARKPSGSFKDRRASVSVHAAQRQGYPGVVAATSGNYGAAVASQAAKAGLRCIIVQEAFDNTGLAQPKIAEKTRACEAYGAEVMRLSVDDIVVVQETEYTGAGKHPLSQLNLATQLGIAVVRSAPRDSTPGKTIVIPHHAAQIEVVEVDVDRLRRLYVRNALHTLSPGQRPTETDSHFLAADTNSTPDDVREVLHALAATTR